MDDTGTLAVPKTRVGQTRALVVSIHDVSPQTFTAAAGIVRELELIGIPACSLLVIANHHRRGHFLEDARFCEWLREQAAAGHEIVMHGYYHERPRRSAEGAMQKITTRLYTADEGEFYDLDRATARELVTQAHADLATLGIAPRGFIAPAWLLSAEAEDALRELELDYTTRLGGVLDLRGARRFAAQSLVWSVRSAGRRGSSLAWNALLFRILRTQPLLRIAIHPVDRAHAAIWRQIRRSVSRALLDREPLTYYDWLKRQRASTLAGRTKS